MTKNEERLFESVTEIAMIIETLTELFGEDAKEWRIKRADPRVLAKVSETFKVLMEYYLDPEFYNEDNLINIKDLIDQAKELNDA